MTTKEEKKIEEDKKRKPIDLRKKVTVYSTDKDKYHATGDPIRVHPIVAEKLLKSGMAKDTAPKKKGTDKEEGAPDPKDTKDVKDTGKAKG